MPIKKSTVKKAALILIGVLMLVGAAGWGLGAAFEKRFHPHPRVAKLPQPQDHTEATRQDLEVLGQLLRLDRSFSPQAAQKFEQERAKLMAIAGDLSRPALEMQVSRLVALAGNGHTTVGRRLRRLNRVPIRLDWFADGLFVVRTTVEHADLLGAQVISINGKTPEELLAGMTPYVSGTPEHAKATIPLFLESPAAMNGVWSEMPSDVATYVLRNNAGQPVTAQLESVVADPQSPYIDPTRNLAPQRIASEAAPWRSVLSGVTDLPLVLREPDASVFVQELDGGVGLYVHIAQVMGDGRGGLSDQLAAIVDAIKPESLRYAILDLRFNGGGNYVETLRFTKELPKRIARDGKLFILTDHATFSAAVVTAARAKYFGGTRSLILGEQLGDRERFWAESGTPLELPNSKILVFFATGYHDWNGGCQWKDLARCFWINILFDVPAGSLAPDKTIAWRFADYRNGIDTVMEEALKERAPLIRKD